jgi:two-component system phosphate regulon sensor histidine kinase PhoR
MFGSMLVLCVFLFLWLKQSYQTELAYLKADTHFQFMASAREIEDSLIQSLMYDPFVMRIRDGEEPAKIEQIHINRPGKMDSSHTLSFIGERVQGLDSLGGNISIRMEASADSADEIFGLLSMFVEDQSFWQQEGNMAIVMQDSINATSLEKRFLKRMKPEDMKVDLKVVRLSDSGDIHQTWVQQQYFNPLSGENYVVELEGYQGYLLRKLTPQLLFALFLLAAIGFSFWLIYRALQQERRLSTLKNEFVSNITHELKTPITTVSVAIEALRNFQALNDPSKTEEYLDISQNELKRLSLLVDRVLRMSQFEQENPQMKWERLDVQEVLDQILNSFKLRFEQMEAELEVEYRGEGFDLEGDRAHLISVLYNLIDNALKYSPEKPVIQLRLEDKTDAIQLEIADQGMGIDPEYQKKVFEKFFRVPTANRHNVKGHGLGLSYVAQVVEAHGGKIELESRPGEGTRFILRLPKQQDA